MTQVETQRLGRGLCGFQGVMCNHAVRSVCSSGGVERRFARSFPTHLPGLGVPFLFLEGMEVKGPDGQVAGGGAGVRTPGHAVHGSP